MGRFAMSEQASKAVYGWHPAQVVFFVMSSRRRNAIVVGAHISKSMADMEARGVGGCVRVGRVVENAAETM